MQRSAQAEDDVVTCFRDGMVTLRKNRRVTGFTESIKEIGYQGVREGDLVIHAMDAFAGAVGVSDSDGKCTPVYAVCQPATGVNPHYYAHLVREMARTRWIAALAKGIRERSTDFRFEAFANQVLPVPPKDEQDRIAGYLNHADRRINRLIRAKRRLIELLNEQKQAIIHHAVTRGLDPDVRLKPSGIDWLGDVPEHWEVRRLRRLVKSIDQGVSPQSDAGLADDASWGVLKAGCVNHGEFREAEHKRLPLEFPIDDRIVVHTGDVLVSRASGSPRLVGSVARVGFLRRRLILSDKTFRLNFRDNNLAPFFVSAMNARYFRVQVERAISGAEGLANNLPVSELKDFVLVVPPANEAGEIAGRLSSATLQVVAAIDRARREIELLREYRTRLIADVVTGKLDVRGVALPQLDDEDALDELEAPDEGDAEAIDDAGEDTEGDA